MGHERTGVLPKTKRWRALVSQLAPAGGGDASTLAASTLDLVGSQLHALERDKGLATAFKFLVRFSLSAKGDNTAGAVAGLSAGATPLQIASALRSELSRVDTSHEYRTLALQAATDAIARWYRNHQTGQGTLFESEGVAAAWREAGQGRGFCELARGFFSSVIERYLLYFLEREAGRVVGSVDDRIALSRHIREHVEDISQHAFETTKIAQSYAAGWFNRIAPTGMPAEHEVDAFLDYAFRKMRDELRVESGRS